MAATLIKMISGLVILIILVVAAGFLTHYFLLRKHPVAGIPKLPPKPTAPVERPIPKPRFEVYPKEEIPVPLPEKGPVHEKPRVAIIVDDIGYDRKMARKFMALDTNLTFSILPHTPHNSEIANKAHKKGIEIMLHLPMEPIEYPAIDPGPGALLAEMSPDELIRQLEKNIASVPHAKGVNNHMGSRLTAESNQIYQVFTILRKRNLFFIDSRSTTKTLCRPSARLFKIPFAERDVFIDHKANPAFIRKQLERLVTIARHRGKAIGIAHPSRTTYKVLHQMLPELKKQIQLVPASELVGIIS